jgi:hypothetical protein
MAGAVSRITDPAFAATGQSGTAKVFGPFNVAIWGSFTGTVAVERQLDGTNWVAVATDGTGTAASYTAPVSVAGEETEPEVLYRFNCTAYSSGTIHCRLSQVVLDYNYPQRSRRIT